MITVLIVDEAAAGLAEDLNGIAEKESIPARFQAVLTPEKMFRRLEDQTPDLILLHHHWHGTTISQLLERVAEIAKDTRVIVFTGQQIDVSELIACVRFGVADYWTERGTLDPVVVFRQAAHYCSSSAWTLRNLGMSSGSVLKLLAQAETSVERIAVLERENDDLQARVGASRSQEARAIRRMATGTIEFVIYIGTLTAAVLIIKKYTDWPVWGTLCLVAIFAVFFLLLKGRLAEALFKWGGNSASVKGK